MNTWIQNKNNIQYNIKWINIIEKIGTINEIKYNTYNMKIMLFKQKLLPLQLPVEAHS